VTTKEEQHLKQAEECEQLALETSDSAEKKGYMILAKQWRKMAKEVSRRDLQAAKPSALRRLCSVVVQSD
jgi:hypothetical protein